MSITQQRVVDADHPWLGLSPYTEETQEFFFGRDLEVRELFRRVREQPLTVLFGQSGLGKSSLLGAGLLPKLRVERFRPTLLRLGYEATDPPLIQQLGDILAKTIATNGNDNDNDPLQTPALPLPQTLPQNLPQPQPQSQALPKTLPQALPLTLPQTLPLTLWERFHHLASRPDDLEEAPLVLIFDQFEEIFTLATTKVRQAEAGELFRQLADLIENRPPQSVQERMRSDRRVVNEYDLGLAAIHVVITLREDFLSQLEAYKKLMPALMRNRMALRMLSGPQALEAVIRPGRLQGRNLVTDDVGERIVRFVADRTPDTPLAEIDAVPPLLSLLCDELNQLRLEHYQPTLAGDQASLAELERVGQSILDSFYTRSFNDLHPALRAYVEDRMVTVGGHRNPIAYEDAIAELLGVGVVNPANAIHQLIQGRLLSIEDRGGIQRLEITHDVLTPLVVRSRDERRERQRAEKAEGEREEAKQRELKGRRERRRWQLLAAGMSVLALVAICGMAWAVVATRSARLATQEAKRQKEEAIKQEGIARTQAIKTQIANEHSKVLLAEAAQSDRASARNLWNLGRHRDAVAHWARSFKYEPDSSVELDQIVSSMCTVPWGQSIETLTGHTDLVNHAAFSPDGTRIVTASEDNTARIWDAITGQAIETLTGHTGLVRHAAFSPDGTRIVTASSDNTARIWDATTGQPIETLTGHTEGVGHAAFSPDGTRILTASDDNTARIWDATTGQAIGTLTGHTGGVSHAGFSPDGTRIVTASWDNTVKIWDATTGQAIATLTGHIQVVRHAAFSPDGTRIVTASQDNTARIWELAAVKSVPPEWFGDFLRCVCGRTHDVRGELVNWAIADNDSRSPEQIQKLARDDKTRYGDIARYFLTPHPHKPTYIGSKVTCGEAADRLIRPNAQPEELVRAYNWHPGHPLIQIALAKFETEPVRATFLREYGVSRLLKREPSRSQTAAEIAQLCRRAEALLRDQGDLPRAESVRRRAEELETKTP